MERNNLIKDISIVRQSSIKIALEFCKVHGIQPTMKELIRLTDVFAEDSLLTPDDEFKKTVDKIDIWVISKKKK
jgi:hypothetical protein